MFDRKLASAQDFQTICDKNLRFVKRQTFDFKNICAVKT